MENFNLCHYESLSDFGIGHTAMAGTYLTESVLRALPEGMGSKIIHAVTPLRRAVARGPDRPEPADQLRSRSPASTRDDRGSTTARRQARPSRHDFVPRSHEESSLTHRDEERDGIASPRR